MCKTTQIFQSLCYTNDIDIANVTENIRHAIDYIAGFGFVGISIIIAIIGIVFRIAIKAIIIAILVVAAIAALVYFAGHGGLLDGLLLELAKYFPDWVTNH